MNTSATRLLYILAAIILFVPAKPSHAAAACSTVKIETLQEMTLERIAFDAKLKVTSKMSGKSLVGLSVDIVILEYAETGR